MLDEIADTILPTTNTPGAKAAATGAVHGAHGDGHLQAGGSQKIFRDGLRHARAECRKANNVDFMTATPAQRLALLERLDREQKAHTDAREGGAQGDGTRRKPREGETRHNEVRAFPARPAEDGGSRARRRSGAAAITADTPTHYFRMMKELTLLGYFTSEIGCTQALRYVESPGRYDPCVPYTPGEKAWAGHA